MHSGEDKHGDAPVIILHVLDHGLPLQSGYVFRTLGILAAQRRRGWKTVHVTSPKHNVQAQPAGDQEEVDGWEYYRTASAGLPATPVLGEAALMRRLGGRLDEVVRAVRPDIIHAHSPVLNGLPALHVGRRHGIPVVYEVRAFWEDAAVDHGTTAAGSLRYRSSRALETFLLKRAGAVTTICEGLRNEIIGRGIPKSKVTVIPNAVDIQAFAADRQRDIDLARHLGIESNAVVLGFIGSFYRYEGIDLLLDALPSVLSQHPDVKVLLVGGGPHEQALRAIAADQRFGSKVIFTGRVKHQDVQRYYDLIDIFVYPRRHHRLTDLVTPLKPLEAFAARRIVVASDVGGHRELIADGKTGFLFPADNAAALAQRLCTTIEQRPEWPSMQTAARQFVETTRTWDACVVPYGPVYSNLMTQSRAA